MMSHFTTLFSTKLFQHLSAIKVKRMQRSGTEWWPLSNRNRTKNINRFDTKLYRQIVGIPMGTNCAPLVADLFLFFNERDFMKDLSSDNQADVIKAFNSTSIYLDDLLNIDNPYFEGNVGQPNLST